MKVVSELIGYPRIGPHRELKWALEDAWKGRVTADSFATKLRELRSEHLAEQIAAIGSAVQK